VAFLLYCNLQHDFSADLLMADSWCLFNSCIYTRNLCCV